jgi:cyclopropane fatty-acyl-phospholipid synthase-like methyltransferase
MAAGLGLDVTGVDLAVTALHTAERKAQDRGLSARFLHQDARRLADLGESFDTVLDCGLFHVFTGDDRDAFAAGLRSAVRPGGRYFMLGFSDRQPGGPGPHRLTREDITGTFAAGWRADSVEPATIEVTTSPAGVPAWLAAFTRI